MIAWLQQEWIDLTSKYCHDKDVILGFWTEIVAHYNNPKKRHYHNLTHIYLMLKQANALKAKLVDYDAVKFAIWYHDIIYNTLKTNNELKSAELAKNRLESLNFDKNRIKIVENLIKSTKKHDIVLKENQDNAYLLDMDLSVLGTDWKTYEAYIENIRKEYRNYPYILYKKGRKKAMRHFLERKHIFFTNAYRNTHEQNARTNIKREIEDL